MAAAAVAVAGPRLGGADPAVVVADERGRELASVPLPEDHRFALTDRHSVYQAEVTETFAVTAAASGWSRSPPPARPCSTTTSWRAAASPTTAGAWSRPPPPRLASLPLVATEVGRRTLVAGDRRLPLFEPGAAPGPPGPQRPPLTRDQPGSRARQWTVPLTGGSAAVPMAGSSWVAPGWMGTLRLTAPTPTRSPLML